MDLLEVRGKQKEIERDLTHKERQRREVLLCEKEPLGPFQKMFWEPIITYLKISAMSLRTLKVQREGTISTQHYFLIVYSID